jgi:hypothetical protein
MAQSCSTSGPVFHLPTLESFLDLVAAQETRLYRLVSNLLYNSFALLGKRIGKEVVKSDIYLVDVNGVIDSFNVQSTSIDDFSLVSIKATRSTVQCSARVKIDVQVSYEDPYNDLYYVQAFPVPFGQIEEVIKREIIIPVELEVTYDIEEKTILDVGSIIINNEQPIGIKTGII